MNSLKKYRKHIQLIPLLLIANSVTINLIANSVTISFLGVSARAALLDSGGPTPTSAVAVESSKATATVLEPSKGEATGVDTPGTIAPPPVPLRDRLVESKAPPRPTYAFSMDTEHLIIRNLTPADRPAVHKILIEEDASEKSGQTFKPRNVETIMGRAERAPLGDDWTRYFAIEEKASGKVIGFIQLANTALDDEYGSALRGKLKSGMGESFALGYFLAKEARGKKYSTEALSKIKDYAFKSMAIKQLVAKIHPGNLASQRALLSSKDFVLGAKDAKATDFNDEKADYFFANAPKPEPDPMTAVRLFLRVQESVSHLSVTPTASSVMASTVVSKTVVVKGSPGGSDMSAGALDHSASSTSAF